MVVNTKAVAADDEPTRQYMISRAKSCVAGGDSAYAKCWLMTANALFPANDTIKMESYEMSKCDGNVDEAVKYLCDMFDSQECRDQLLQELYKIIISCRNEWQTHHLSEQRLHALFNGAANQWPTLTPAMVQFYGRLFNALSTDYQYRLLRRVADTTQDKLVLIDLMLFIVKKFPDSVTENGLKLIDIMDDNDMQSSTDESDDQLSQYIKKKLVFDVLPLIFAQNSQLVLPSDMIQKLIQKSLKYFVDRLIATQMDRSDVSMDSSDNNPDNNCSDKESNQLLEMKTLEIFHLIGVKNEWKLFEKIDFRNEKQFDVIYDKISHYIDDNRFRGDTDSPMDLSSATTAMIGGDERTNQQILYATLVLFLQCLHKYRKLSADIVLIEQSNHSYSDSKIVVPLNKKRKLAEPDLMTTNPQLRQIFVVASKCLKLLNENLTISSDYIKISEIIGLNSCQSYHSFVIDSNIYRAEYTDVLSQIMARKTPNIKSYLQLISVSLMLHDYNATLKHCLDSIECLPLLKNNNNGSNGDKIKDNDSSVMTGLTSGDMTAVSARHIYFLQLTVDHIFNYIIETITLCLKDRILLSLKPSDVGIGHLLVLSQYKWPQNVQLFLTCMAFINNCGKLHGSQSQPKFTYQYFFNYIFIPDVIEEVMSIVDRREVSLELKPSATTLGAQLKTSSKVITTRGVNKGFIEENRSALIQQMKVSKTSLPNQLFIDFINKEIRTFITSSLK